MIIKAVAPGKIGFLGGGTDVNPYQQEHGGCVLNMAINLRTHVTLLSGDDMWSHPYNKIPNQADPKLLYTILDEYGLGGMHSGITIQSEFDGGIEAGLGSSASFSVALIAAIARYRNLGINRSVIAKEAYRIEVEKLGWHGGKQDQYASSFGGVHMMRFDGDNATLIPTYMSNRKLEEFAEYGVLFNIGGTRESRKIQNNFKSLTKKKKKILDQMAKMACDGYHLIQGENYRDFGKLLDEAWKLKRESNKGVTTPRIDDIYAFAKVCGAWGGKVLGAGKRGYMFFMVPFYKRKYLIKRMKESGIEDVDFSIDFTGVEARIV